MIRRLHRSAPLVLSLLLMGIGFALGAAAQGTVQITNVPEPVTQREFYTVLASGFVLTVLGTAGAVRLMFSSALQDLRGVVESLRQSVARYEDRQYSHNADSTAHSAALAPVYAKIDRFREEMGDAVEEAIGHREKRRSSDAHTGGPNDSGPVFVPADITYPRRDGNGGKP